MPRSSYRFWLPPERLPLRSHLIGMMVGVACAIVAALLVRRGDGTQALVLGAVLTAGLGTCFTAILYHGVRFDAGVVRWTWRRRSDVDSGSGAADAVGQLADKLPMPDFGDSALGIFLAFLAWIGIAAAAAALLWFGIEFVLLAATIIGCAVYWCFRRGTRLALRHQHRCRGRLLSAVLVGGAYGAAYAAGIALIVFGLDRLV